MGNPALAGTGCAAIHNLQICDRFQDDFAEYVSYFGFSLSRPVAFLQVIFCHFPVIPSRYPAGRVVRCCHHLHRQELHMTSWITWEIWWSRVWGESEVPQYGEDEHEVAHEPSRLPVEMVQQGRDQRAG
ncbi:hypothetical protein [Aeromonas veronii]|uniref:hypothetical protein n=2 Tax=Aeromonas veronii TaxID=654 RepID=UPI003B9EF5BA